MKQFSTGLCAVVILFFVLSPGWIQAQTTGRGTAVRPFSYDISQEITLSGTVSNILVKAAPGMIVGAHFLFETSGGLVDASLGRFAFEGKGALTLAAGQQIEAAGVMRMIKGRQVLLVRTVKVDGEVYNIRSEHGISMSPQARERAGKNTGEKGDSL